MNLDFKSWLLTEMSRFRISSDITMPGMGMPHNGLVHVNGIDMRFEDYDSGINKTFFEQKFKAKIPGKPERWLVFSDLTAAVVSGKVAKALDYDETESDWWLYAEGYHDNHTVKYAKRERESDAYDKLAS